MGAPPAASALAALPNGASAIPAPVRLDAAKKRRRDIEFLVEVFILFDDFRAAS